MISVEAVKKSVGMLALMAYFPSDEEFRAALVELLGEMCNSDTEVLWLARRMRNLYPKWPGAHELRAVLCSKYSPRDGIEVYSGVYGDGIPSENGDQPLQIAGPAVKALPEGHSASVDPELEEMVGEVAESCRMAALPKYRARSPEEIRVDAELRQLFKLGTGEIEK